MSNEQWRDVRGYEGYYEVSDLGRVRRVRGGRGATVGRILRAKEPNRTSDYRRVQLCRNDVKRTVTVHFLVCEAFHGKRPRKKVPNHINMDKLDNRACNLEWCTLKQNAQHALKNGRRNRVGLPGEQNGRAKLTGAQVAVVRKLKGVVGQRDLALLCGVSKTAIQLIHQGKHWK